MLTKEELAELERLRAESDARAALPKMEDLYKLAQTQPVVHQALMLMRRGDVTHLQALIGIILQLSAQLEETQGRLTDVLSKQPPPPLIIRKD